MEEDCVTDNFDAEEQELLAKLAEVKAKREAARIAAELEQEVVIYFDKLAGNYIHIRNEPFRQDVLEVMQSIEGRMWKPHEKVNAIPIGMYETFLQQTNSLKRVKLKYAEGLKELIKDELYAPDFHCTLEARHLMVKASRKAMTYELRRIPGHNFNYTRNLHEIPLTEGWRLYDFASKENSFTWSDDARAFVIKQVGDRLRLDELAKKDDIELVIPNLNAKLKNFQKIGIEFFNINGGRGILADEMGTGKTLQMIGLMVMKKYKSIVVCPAALKENWLRELRKFAPHFTTYTCQGEAPSKYDITELLTKRPDVIIINYDIIGRSVEHKTVVKRPEGDLHKSEIRYPWVEVLNLLSYDLLVMDEAHYIKNIDSHRSKGTRKMEMKSAIGLTGTPILNRPQELWAMLHMADSTTFPAYETFKNQYTYDGKTVRNVEELKQLLKPLMIRRLKRDVIKELEPINRINSYYELSEKGRKLYDRVLSGVFDVLAEWNPNQAGSQKEVTNMLVQIQRLKQVVAIDGVEGTADLATEIYDSSPDETISNKVLIFSQFKATTYAISRRLGAESLSFVSMNSDRNFITADNTEQQKLIDQFQNDPNIHFLCVTEKTAKEGHNITAAKAVIFNDLFWTPAGHQQAEARAYGRISDLHTIDSYYRIGINSISEHIMKLLAAKLAIIEQVVEGVEASRADVSIINELLSALKDELWTMRKSK